MCPKFSIITPSFRQLDWLKLCAASIADQQGVEVEHIVQDAGTGPELEAWAASQAGLKLYVEKDKGMYDAVNRAFRRASGEILAYLNCDEQYLPGALAEVAKFFAKNPSAEVVFADALVMDPRGRFKCFRKAILPQRNHTMVSGNIAILTCATFFRRKVIAERGLMFEPEWKVSGDAVWVLKLIEQKVTMAVMQRFTSAFFDTGANLSLSPAALHEQATLFERAPVLARKMRKLVILHYRLRKLLLGAYRQEPLSYSIYTCGSPDIRQTFQVSKPSFVWANRSTDSADAR